MMRCFAVGLLSSPLALAGCGSSGGGAGHTDGNTVGASDAGGDSNGTSKDAGPTDAAINVGGAITCPSPGNPKKNGSGCGTERWNIKTGTDSQAAGVSLVPKPNTVAALDALPAAGGGNSRETPTETTLWELTDVTLTEIKMESDSDYHLVLSDGTHTMIAEIPYLACATSSVWTCFISRARAQVETMFVVSTTPQYPATTVTLRGVGFFDFVHGQNGVAPNAIELHPVLQLCFGKSCTPT
jgi:hypothetical protein